MRALSEVYHLSWLLAFVLTLAGCVCAKRLSYSLDDLRAHNAIEHDGSLSRADAAPGAARAPTAPDPARLASLLPEGADALTLDDLCRVRRARDAALARPLSHLHAEIARGEVALAFLMFARRDGTVPASDFRCWFGQDRLPDGWAPPMRSQGLFATRNVAAQVAQRVAQLAKGE